MTTFEWLLVGAGAWWLLHKKADPVPGAAQGVAATPPAAPTNPCQAYIDDCNARYAPGSDCATGVASCAPCFMPPECMGTSPTNLVNDTYPTGNPDPGSGSDWIAPEPVPTPAGARDPRKWQQIINTNSRF